MEAFGVFSLRWPPSPIEFSALLHLALSWILSKVVENLASSSLSLVVSLAQLVSPSVALLAKLVILIYSSNKAFNESI